MKTRLAAYVTAVLALTPVIAQSQSDEKILRSGDRVRLWKDGRTQIATLVQASDDEVVYRVANGSPVSVKPDAITALDVSGGRHGNSGKGALIGAGVGAAFGLFAVAAMSSDEFLSPTAGEAAAAIVVSTAGGAVLGLAIGAAIRSEEWTAIPSPWSAAAQAPNRSVNISFVFPIGR